MLLESPRPEVDFERDALSVPTTLTFLDMIDMLSADGLECVSRKLHHGWEDRSCACRRARVLARKTLGTCVGIALGGGAAFGIAHVGVFQVLVFYGIAFH